MDEFYAARGIRKADAPPRAQRADADARAGACCVDGLPRRASATPGCWSSRATPSSPSATSTAAPPATASPRLRWRRPCSACWWALPLHEKQALPRRPRRPIRPRTEGPSLRRDHAPPPAHHVLGHGLQRRTTARTTSRLANTLRQKTEGGADTVREFKQRDAPAGTRFRYASGDSQVLGLVLRDAVQQPLADYLSEKIWRPMGAEADATWLLDKAGYETGYCCINATLRDCARFGMLLANYGAIDGKQIIPAEWVKAATTPEAPHLRVGTATPNNGYGYQTWILGLVIPRGIPQGGIDSLRRPRRPRPGHLRRPRPQARRRPHRRMGRRRRPRRARRPIHSCSKPSTPSWKANDLRRQAQAAPPDPAEEQARLHAPRLRGQGQHPVRRLRPRLHQRRADPGLLGARHPAAPRRQALRHRLQLQDPRLLPRQLARLQHRPRPHALASSPAPTSPTASSSTSASPATATPPPSASASSPTSCAAA